MRLCTQSAENRVWQILAVVVTEEESGDKNRPRRMDLRVLPAGTHHMTAHIGPASLTTAVICTDGFLCTIIGMGKLRPRDIKSFAESHEGAICCYPPTQIATEHHEQYQTDPRRGHTLTKQGSLGKLIPKLMPTPRRTSHRAKPCCSSEQSPSRLYQPSLWPLARASL